MRQPVTVSKELVSASVARSAESVDETGTGLHGSLAHPHTWYAACIAENAVPKRFQRVEITGIAFPARARDWSVVFGATTRRGAEAGTLDTPRCRNEDVWWRSKGGAICLAGKVHIGALPKFQRGGEIKLVLDYSNGDGLSGLLSVSCGTSAPYMLSDNLPIDCIPYIGVRCASVTLLSYDLSGCDVSAGISLAQERIAHLIREQDPTLLDGLLQIGGDCTVRFPTALQSLLPALQQGHICRFGRNPVLWVLSHVLSGKSLSLTVAQWLVAEGTVALSVSDLAEILATAIDLGAPRRFLIDVLNVTHSRITASTAVPLLKAIESLEISGFHREEPTVHGENAVEVAATRPWTTLKQSARDAAAIFSAHADFPLKDHLAINDLKSKMDIYARMGSSVSLPSRLDASFLGDTGDRSCNEVLRDLRFTNGDFELDVEGHASVQVHRFLMHAAGGHFARLAAVTGFREAHEARVRVDLQGVPYSAFCHIINALYSPSDAADALDAADFEDAVGILAAAPYWGLDEPITLPLTLKSGLGSSWFAPLLQRAQEIADSGVSPDTCFDMFSAACALGHSDVCEEALKVMRDNVEGPAAAGLVSTVESMHASLRSVQAELTEFKQRFAQLESLVGHLQCV